MNKYFRSFFAVFVFLISISLESLAQNVPLVPIREALMIRISEPVTYTRYARSEFPYDPIGYALISNTLASPMEGETLKGTNAKWERVSASGDGYFKSANLNGGGIYFEYNSPKVQIMMLGAAGHDKVFVNGIPREGDHFDTGQVQIPVEIRTGKNTFYLTGGISNRIKAGLFLPKQPVALSTGFMTKPDLIREESSAKWASVLIMNASNLLLTELAIRCSINGANALETPVPPVEKLTSKRIPYQIPGAAGINGDTVEVVVNLIDKARKVLSSVSFYIKNKSVSDIHENTFVSKIDGSVQYYSVIPGKIPAENSSPALIMAVHGAGLEARNLAKVYDPKSWANIVLPTNRGAFGFAWEDWGRLDFLEVFEIGKKLFPHDPQKVYLTGHSMGGHASWYLGATYPDHWAAIGPCAGYPQLHEWIGHSNDEKQTGSKLTFMRAGNSQLTKKLYRNYLHHGIYVNHGNADPTVSVEHAREMRSILGSFHADFAYYEYPGGNHWYGDLSADWPPLFDFLKIHLIPKNQSVRKLEFNTFSPGISSSSHWATIYQQTHPYQLSNVTFQISNDSTTVSGTTENVKILSLDLDSMALRYPAEVVIDQQKMKFSNPGKMWLSKTENDGWEQISQSPGFTQKGPHRNGNFKDAFRHNVVFVYGTKGSPEENNWLYYKARYDAETFGYRGNGSIEIIPDKNFKPENYPDRGVIVYGNSVNNSAWMSLLSESPIQVLSEKIVVGNKEFTGTDLACYFLFPRRDSQFASVGVVSGTGLDGFKATYANAYFQAGTAFPDFTVFRNGAATEGYGSVECTGWFGNDWKVGETFWK